LAIYYVTPAGAGAKNGATWATAFDLAAWKTHAEGSASPGDIYYVAGGTYTLTGNWDTSSQDGTAASPITIIGVKTGTTAEPPTVDDWADGTDRPLIACVANSFKLETYWTIKNFRFTGSAYWFTTFKDGCIVDNCKFTKTESGYALEIHSNNSIINCEIQSASVCIRTQGYNKIIGCYFHDSPDGVFFDYADGNLILSCIFDTISTEAIRGNGKQAMMIINNTFYNCGHAISETTGRGWVVLNNIVSDCTDGFEWTTATVNNYYDYNNYYNNYYNR